MIIFGLKEDNSQVEVIFFRGIRVDQLGMQSEQVKAFRLGKKHPGGTRPILVKLEDMKCKSKIMKRCHLLKRLGISSTGTIQLCREELLS